MLRLAIALKVRTVRLPPKPARQTLPVQPLEKGEKGKGVAWHDTVSSWITGLRFIPTARVGNQALASGYIDMRTGPRYRHAYRYGPGISQRSFNTWLVAASRGKYWWRYFTRRWSPARKLW